MPIRSLGRYTRPTSKVENEEELDECEVIKKRAGFITLVCRLSGVSQDRFEEWRDSMSDEYFYWHCKAIFEEDMLKMLMRAI